MKKFFILFLLVGLIGCTDVGDFMAEDAHCGYVVESCLNCHLTQPPYTPGEVPAMDLVQE
jgi:hypothetical protein